MKEKLDIMRPLLKWLHECIDENKRGKAYDWDMWSDGSGLSLYKSKHYKWEIHNEHGGSMTVAIDDEFVPLFELKWL
jgi:hypothetical protein